VTIGPIVHVEEHHNRTRVGDEVLAILSDLVDAFRQGPMPAAVVLLTILLAIRALVVPALLQVFR
jgi:hypothetical protein